MQLRELLEESIRLREDGHVVQSLELLDRAIAEGISNGWVDDNRARALVRLQRFDEARALWTALESSDDLTLRRVAGANLRELSLDEQVERFHAEVQRIAKGWEWTLQHLDGRQLLSPAFEFALLEEAVIARETGSPKVSLALLDWAIAAGFQSPWLQDNRARALLALDRVVDACDVWRALLASSGLEEAKASARDMLRSAHREEEIQRRVAKEQLWLEQAHSCAQTNGLQAAIDHLARGLLLFPDSSACEQALLLSLEQLRQQQDPDWHGLTAWMQHQELAVEGFEQVLLALESQLSASKG